ncbi:MFS transporter [Enhygromyxa salina]|uniref:Muropeptide transporter n=1 Tax=Enhygromyxa salina TaxID=215803 RepID=A0A2S9Y0D6_9BACT|nr:MFS transporter [Enhygromyxa salina]PRP98572.1 muropeptide transporter [Enhygromyxa salina]
MAEPAPRLRHPLAWVPTAYLAEGIPFAMVIWVAGTLFKDLGHSDGDITVALASIGLAWSLKPFWAAFLGMFRTKRFFVLTMELLIAVLLGLVALALPLPNYFQIVIAILWVMAFASATQDICVDGIYITSLDPANQAKYIGVQGMAWNVGRIFATAGVVWVAGMLQDRASYAPEAAWAVALGLSGATMAALAVYHLVMLPPGSKPTGPQSTKEIAATFVDTVRDFFRKDKIWGMLAFVFLFRSAEGLLLVEAPLFMQAPLEEGGLGMTLIQKGVIDGTISTAVSIIGGLLGGWFVSRYGLARSLFFLALCLNLPNICYVYLSWTVSPEAPLSMTTIGVLVTIEKFGYSFGFVANMLYMMQQISPGRYHMTHYAFCTALMNLVLIPTQMASGPLADWMGYRAYFVFVVVATIPSLVAAKLAPFPRDQAGPKDIPP